MCFQYRHKMLSRSSIVNRQHMKAWRRGWLLLLLLFLLKTRCLNGCQAFIISFDMYFKPYFLCACTGVSARCQIKIISIDARTISQLPSDYQERSVNNSLTRASGSNRFFINLKRPILTNLQFTSGLISHAVRTHQRPLTAGKCAIVILFNLINSNNY